MTRTALLLAVALATSTFGLTTAYAADAPKAATASAKYTTADTQIGTLLDDPAAKAILMKHVPQLAGSAQIDMARTMTLKQVQGYASDMLTDDALAKIDADLAKLPSK
ncbi:MAG: hypothetical protein JWQ16_2222 [Novosphingobium sp.]|nr:hypothetical protein [Novosphingobium sp.]